MFAVLYAACPASAYLTLDILDTTSISFGALDPGEFKEIPSGAGYANRVKVVSDSAVPWTVSIRDTAPLTRTGGSSRTIANTYFKWLSTYAGKWDSGSSTWWDLTSGLDHQPTDGYVEFSSAAGENFYTSGRVSGKNDSNNAYDGTEIGFKYAIQPPEDQMAGTYTTTIVYTLTQ